MQQLTNKQSINTFVLTSVVVLILSPIVNPAGHNAVYFERICAKTPVTLRQYQPSELSVVLSRYQGISGYGWVAIPLTPYH
jgi:hypothetical protein